MRVSKRSLEVHRAQSELEGLILEKASELDLTNIELLQALASTQQSLLKYMLRAERHPNDPDKWADEE